MEGTRLYLSFRRLARGIDASGKAFLECVDGCRCLWLVVRPDRLRGHIVQGGALCMELLTNTGWSSVSSMESVLMQIRLAIASRPAARLDRTARGGDVGDYGIDGCATEGMIKE